MYNIYSQTVKYLQVNNNIKQTKVLTYEHTPTADSPKELVIMVSHAPAETKNPTVITMMAGPKRFSGNSHTMKILTNDITVKLNVSVTALILSHSMHSASSKYKA